MVGTERTLETVMCRPNVNECYGVSAALVKLGRSNLGALGACTKGPRQVGASEDCTGSPRAEP